MVELVEPEQLPGKAEASNVLVSLIVIELPVCRLCCTDT